MKKHTLVKIASMAMAAAMLASTGAGSMMTAFAQSNKTAVTEAQKQEKMKAALTKVKKRFTVPSHVSEFTYRTNNDFSTDCFYFTWTTPNDAKVTERYNAVIIDDVIIYYNYRKNENNDYKQSFAKLTDEQLVSKAKEHLKKLNPSVYADGIYTITGITLFGKEAFVQFQRKENGVIVDGNGFTLTLNKDTGELINMEGEWWQNVTFRDPASKLTEEQAIAAFEKLCTLTPAYAISYDWETKEHTARLVYRPSFTAEIDAFTGKASTIWEDMNKDKGTRYNPHGYGYTAMLANGLGSDAGAVTEEACMEEDAEVEFTEAELKEIEADKSLLTKDQITKLLQDNKYIGLFNKATITRSYLNKDEESGEYFYTLYYQSGDGSSVTVPYNGYYDEEIAEEVEEVDAEDDAPVKKEKNYSANFYLNAKTGKIENFSQSVINDLSDKNPYPVKANLEKAKSAIKNFYPDICGEYRSAVENSQESEFWQEEKTGIKHYETTRTFTFKRYVNNVVVEGDTINITVANDGQITYARYNHTDVEFPSAPKFDKEKAFKELFAQQNMNLYYDGYYKPDGTMKTYLIYKTADFTLDRNYKLCAYSGQELISAEYTDTNYTDIKGHKYEKAITTLARYGITLDSENRKFNPDGTLTDEEFGQAVYQAMRAYRPYAITNSSDEKKPLTLTRALAAKVFVSAANSDGDEIAQLKGIFKSPYSDVPEDSEYVGYIAIANAMELMPVSGDKFYPDSKVTRGAAMQFIYNYIVSLK